MRRRSVRESLRTLCFGFASLPSFAEIDEAVKQRRAAASSVAKEENVHRAPGDCILALMPSHSGEEAEEEEEEEEEGGRLLCKRRTIP